MIKLNILFPILVLSVMSCDKVDPKYPAQNPARFVVRGACQYTDVMSGKLINDNSKIDVSLIYFNSAQQLEPGVKASSTGANFEFGPLPVGNYTLRAEYFDSASSIYYSNDKAFRLDTSVIQNINLLPSKDANFIKGSVTYRDLFSGKETAILKGLEVTLESYDDLVEIPNGGQATVNGGSYSIGPLPAKTYKISYHYTDNYGLHYNSIEQLSSGSLSGALLKKDIILEHDPNTILIATLVDSLSNPIPYANAFLYSNYTFLKTYKDTPGASLSQTICDSKGRAVFIGLDPRAYYVYGTKLIGDDTLNSLKNNYSNLSLLMNSVNSQQIVLRK